MSLARTRAKTLGAFALAWVVTALGSPGSHLRVRLFAAIEDLLRRNFEGPALDVAQHLQRAFFATSMHTGFYAVWLGTIAWSLGFIVRMFNRSVVRMGEDDVLEPLRAWLRAHKGAMPALTLSAGLAWTLSVFKTYVGYRWDIPVPLFGMALLDGLAMAWWVHFSVRAFLAPTGEGESSSRFEISDDEIVFDAVAATFEARAAVIGLTVLTLATMALLASPVFRYASHAPMLVGIGYSVVAAASAVAFRLGSRVAIGLDGVHVRGTSRAKFYAYRDLDEARLRWNSIELVRGGRVLVSLQLHGEDVVRRNAVLARITENLARVKEGRGAVAAQMVASSTKEALARVAHGGGDYRMAALTREQLWALVEGPEIEASARKAAAEALATSSDGSERARLRVAASLCAEPHVRVALEELAGGEGDATEAPMRRAAT